MMPVPGTEPADPDTGHHLQQPAQVPVQPHPAGLSGRGPWPHEAGCLILHKCHGGVNERCKSSLNLQCAKAHIALFPPSHTCVL